MSKGRAAQLALGAAAWLWTALIVWAPGLVFPIGQFICHQRPERSFFLNGHQFAVCARCTGLYVGAALAVPLALAAAMPLASRRARWLLAAAALPTALTWTLEFAGLFPFSNIARFTAALPLGASAAWLVLTTLNHRPSSIGHRPSDVAHRPDAGATVR